MGTTWRRLTHNRRPPPAQRRTTPQETEIATLVARAYGAGREFDKTTFVIKGALSPFPGLVYRPEQIAWCGDRAVDEYFGKTLELEQMQGNELVAVGKAPRVRAFLYLAAMRRFGGVNGSVARGPVSPPI